MIENSKIRELITGKVRKIEVLVELGEKCWGNLLGRRVRSTYVSQFTCKKFSFNR